ncbi:MAG: PAS domain-containing protein [Acidobacteria bacterium]|nr:PAS domain-containing protein [Acidobacteriota bacterium]
MENKLLALMVGICLVVSLGAMHIMFIVEKDRQYAGARQRLQNIARRNALLQRELFSHKLAKATTASRLVRQILPQPPSLTTKAPPAAEGRSARRGTDSAGVSGFFISELAPPAPHIQELIRSTETLWQILGPLMREDFLDFYLITADQFIRITPPDWAMEIERDHDFTRDIFYYPATPEQNPAGKPVWTPVYYDSIHKHWMISLLVPVSIEGQFLGITGSDFILDSLFARINRWSILENFGTICLFDHEGNIIVHPRYMGLIQQRHAEMNDTLSFRDIPQQGLAATISNYLEDIPPDGDFYDFRDAGEQQLAYLQPLGVSGWHLVVYVPHSTISAPLVANRWNIVITTLLIALVLILVLRFGIRRIILARVLGLERASRALTHDEPVTFPQPGNDEIGSLIRAFQEMARTLRRREQELQEHNRILAEFNEKLKVNERHLKTKKDELQAILDNATAVIYVKDLQGRYVLVNRNYEKMFGVDRQNITGATVHDIFPPEDAHRYETVDQRVIETEVPVEIEEMAGRGGEERFFLSLKFPLYDADDHLNGVCSISTDISERKKAEEERRRLEQQIQHTQKLESLGVLAGGIAHDFNNLLVGILGNADLALTDDSLSVQARHNVREIERSALQAADLCRQMLAYAGKGKLVVEPLSLNELIKEMKHLLELTVFRKARLSVHLAPRLRTITGDISQIRQVIMNLLINAAEALPAAGGEIQIRTGMRPCDQSFGQDAFGAENFQPGEYIFLEVTDSGDGLSPNDIPKIFEPFYTTKFTGRGLGLAAVLGIVRGHHGMLTVASAPGQGSTFTVFFPAADQSRLTEATVGATVDVCKDSGTVLLVDDDATVRQVGQLMLDRLGFTVLTATDGLSAVEIFRRHADRIDCILLDLTMPNLSGEKTYLELQRIRPGVPTVIMSGFAAEEINDRFPNEAAVGFLQKPFQLASLSLCLQRAMTSRRRGSGAPEAPL